MSLFRKLLKDQASKSSFKGKVQNYANTLFTGIGITLILLFFVIIISHKDLLQKNFISFFKRLELVITPSKKYRVNSIDGAELVHVPEGFFLMGSDKFGPDEKPVHKVFLNSFWIYRNEVTEEQYMNFLKYAKKGYYTFSRNWGRAGYEKNGWLYSQNIFELNLHSLSPLKTRRYPVVQVNWYDAKAYCLWAHGNLPTEAEWEKAARGKGGDAFPWGNSIADETKANFCDKKCKRSYAEKNGDDSYPFLAPVGSFPKGASPYDALDMAGNVWEWTNDIYDEKYYQISPVNCPKGPDSGKYRVIRGGGWSNGMADVRTTNRGRYKPRYGGYFIGFRCKLNE